MPTIEQLGNHLARLHELQSVVRTMKTLSAASIRQYEQATQTLVDYYRTVELGLHVALRDRERPPKPRSHGERTPLVAIVFGSDLGLCGRFNEDLADFLIERLEAISIPHQKSRVLVVGTRIATRIEQTGQAVEENFLAPSSVARITASIQQILLKIDEWHPEKGADRVYVFYNHHISSAHYRPTVVKLLPVNLRSFHRLETQPWPTHVLPTYTMDCEHMFSALLRQYLFVTLFRACAESQASEHGSRLAAMRAAEKNLQERVDEVGMEFRQARQGLITSELLDVVAGFEALTGGKSF
jgi:F-type H+-transporting ATPase subunit gamma